MSSAISISALNKIYGNGFKALAGVDLKIRRSEIFALLGPNGAGKTTLINAAAAGDLSEARRDGGNFKLRHYPQPSCNSVGIGRYLITGPILNECSRDAPRCDSAKSFPS